MKFSSEATYDAAASVQSLCFKELCNHVQSQSPLTLLDLGCGTGKSTYELTQLFPNASIIAIDHSESMVTYAKDHFSHKNITYMCADVTTFVPEKSVDLVLSNAVLQWIDSPDTLIQRYRSYVNKGGMIAVSYFGSDTFRELRTVLDDIDINTPLPSDSFLPAKSISNVSAQHHFTMLFSSFLELLRHIKHTGTRSTHPHIPFFTPHLAKRCDASFLSIFGQVCLTYHAYMYVEKIK